MTAAVTAAPRRSLRATTWITTRPMPPPSSKHLDLSNAVHIGHSTGGGEVARYVAQYGQPQGRVAKAVLVCAVPPLMLKTAANPGRPADRGVRRLPRRRSPPTARSSSAIRPAGPFYGFNRDGAKRRTKA